MITLRLKPGPGVLQQAFDSLPPEGNARILLAPGVYREKAVLARPDVVLEGESAETTRILWDDGAKTLLADGFKRGTFRTATLMLDGDRVTLRHLTVENAAAPREEAGQAVALYCDGDGILLEDCVLLGHQDTLFTAPLPPREVEPRGFIGPKEFAPRRQQRHIYRRCRVQGDVDFIFGGAAALFEDCDIVISDGRRDKSRAGAAYCTAASTPEGQPFGYVFHRCRFLKGDAERHSVYLGRPWREWAKTVLVDCLLEDHIHPDLFHDWGKPLFHQVGRFALADCEGPGMSRAPADFVCLLTHEEGQRYLEEARDFLDVLHSPVL